MPSIKPIFLDGSTLEGGGQLVRVALSLSAITSKPITITNIRANRSSHSPHISHQNISKHSKSSKSNSKHAVSHSSKQEGGLKESHLAAVLHLAQQCNAYLQGAEVGSRELTFIPRGFPQPIPPSILDSNSPLPSYTIELKNPGSVWLILQALLPYLIFRDQQTELVLRGGTNVSKSMSGEYVQLVLVPVLARLGITLTIDIKRRGWAGNAPAIGEVVCRVQPVKSIPNFEIRNRGDVKKIMVKIIAGDEKTKQSFVEVLSLKVAEKFEDVEIEILDVEDSGDSRRIYVLLVAETDRGWRLARDFLGSGKTFRKDAERVAWCQNSCEGLVRELKAEVVKGGCVDEYMHDQLIVFQALAGRTFVDGGVWKGTEDGSLHTRTVRWVCEKMLKVEFDGGGCQGVAWGQKAGDEA